MINPFLLFEILNEVENIFSNAIHVACEVWYLTICPMISGVRVEWILLMPHVPGIHVAAKWMRAFNQERVLAQSILQKVSGQDVQTHPLMVLLVIA